MASKGAVGVAPSPLGAGADGAPSAVGADGPWATGP